MGFPSQTPNWTKSHGQNVNDTNAYILGQMAGVCETWKYGSSHQRMHLWVSSQKFFCASSYKSPIFLYVKFESILPQALQWLVIFGEFSLPDFITLILRHSKLLVHKSEYVCSHMVFIIIFLQRCKWTIMILEIICKSNYCASWYRLQSLLKQHAKPLGLSFWNFFRGCIKSMLRSLYKFWKFSNIVRLSIIRHWEVLRDSQSLNEGFQGKDIGHL